MTDAIARFFAKVSLGPECWVWAASRNAKGYGTFKLNGRSVLAHRFAWRMSGGRLPATMQVCHHCDNPACVRPGHLFLGTAADNQRDSVTKGRANQQPGIDAAAAKRRARTSCIRGHALNAVNVMLAASGARVCRTCNRDSARERYRRLHGTTIRGTYKSKYQVQP